eukprot:CFRG3955T1
MKLTVLGDGEPITETKYSPGQFFAHKDYQYKGVILDSWIAEVNEINSDGRKTQKNSIYYTVLPDNSYTARSSSVTYTYAAHEAIIPYNLDQTTPSRFDHVFFREFFEKRNDTSESGELYRPTSMLGKLQKQNASRMQYSQVYTRITENVKVTAIPMFVRFNYVYYWQYHMSIQNLGKEPLKLHWWNRIITDNANGQQAEGGSALEGDIPTLTASEQSYEHQGQCTLTTPCGSLCGTYSLEYIARPTNPSISSMIKVIIPTVLLDSPYSTELANNPATNPEKDS